MLKLDELNQKYFDALFNASTAGRAKEPLWIHEPGEDPAGKLVAYPTAIAPPELMSALPYVEHADIAAPAKGYAAHAAHSLVWIKKMQAGTGSSMTRTTYLAKLRGIDPSKITIGAKGTDLFIDHPSLEGGRICLAEAQILQAIHDAEHGVFGEVVLQDIVGPETADALEEIWRKPSLKNTKSVRRFGRSFQCQIPTIGPDGKPSTNRVAPGGHALFAVEALLSALDDAKRPKPTRAGAPVVSAIGNGEDLSSTPDAAMVGWMVAEQVPIVMVTTRKTEIDLKGGQIALVKARDGRVHATIIEQAQAKEAGQLALFEQLGLRPGDGVAFFNTNMALFNYDALSPLLKKLVSEIGEAELLRVITPDLIENKKSQVDKDGQTRTYTQLEGAMGSSLLRLDRYWRERTGKPLVHFINVDRESRTRFFSPIKTAFDFFMQFHSDRFGYDAVTHRLVNKRPGTLPSATLGKHYVDVQATLDAFQGTKILALDSLEIDGPFELREVELAGRVKLVNAGENVAKLCQRKLRDETYCAKTMGATS